MIADKHYRMKKPYKRMLALMKGSAELRNGWKRMFIDAQLCEEAARRATIKSKDSGGFGNSRPRGAVAPD